jgi:hypothetical protein
MGGPAAGTRSGDVSVAVIVDGYSVTIFYGQGV